MNTCQVHDPHNMTKTRADEPITSTAPAASASLRSPDADPPKPHFPTHPL